MQCRAVQKHLQNQSSGRKDPTVNPRGLRATASWADRSIRCQADARRYFATSLKFLTIPAAAQPEKDTEHGNARILDASAFEAGVHFGHNTRRWNLRWSRTSLVYGTRCISLISSRRCPCCSGLSCGTRGYCSRRARAVCWHQAPGERDRFQKPQGAAASTTSTTAGSAVC